MKIVSFKKTKPALVLLPLLLHPFAGVFACEICKSRQPKLLRNVAHGAGPQDRWDYFILYAAIAIVLIALVMGIKHLVRPGEKSLDHAKYQIFN